MLSQTPHLASPSQPLFSIPEGQVIDLAQARQKLKAALTSDQYYIAASTQLQGLGPDLTRVLAAHYAFLKQAPDPQIVAYAHFAREGLRENPHSESMAA